MGISSKTLAEHFSASSKRFCAPRSWPKLDVSKRTVWSDQEHLIQIRFRGQGIALILILAVA